MEGRAIPPYSRDVPFPKEMLRNFERLRGLVLAASDGEIGKVRDIYFDDHGWTVRYVVVETGSWLAEREVLIATRVLGAIDEQQHGTIEVHLSKEQVRHSPPVEFDRPVSREYEELVHRHYGWNPYWMTVSAAPGVWEHSPELPISDPPEGGEEAVEGSRSKSSSESYLRSCYQVCGYVLHAKDGEVGHVEDFIIDERDWCVRYLVIGTGKWLPGKKVLLSPEWIEKFSFEESEVYVNLPLGSIKEAPEYRTGEPITWETEHRLHAHYERKAYWETTHDPHES